MTRPLPVRHQNEPWCGPLEAPSLTQAHTDRLAARLKALGDPIRLPLLDVLVQQPAAGDGQFDVMIVTEDDQQYVVPASAGAMTALVALATAGTVLAWDPLNRSLIVANIVGTMPWTVSHPS